MHQTHACPKCDGDMIRGRLYTVASERTDPEKMFGYVNWEASEEKKFDGLYAYRCNKCGYIEYYAERKSKSR